MCTSSGSEARALAIAFATFGRFQLVIRTDDRGYIEVGDHCRTSAEGVWAVSVYGSCTLKPAVGLVISWSIVRLQLAVNASSTSRLERQRTLLC